MLTVEEIRQAMEAKKNGESNHQKLRKSIIAQQRAKDPETWDRVFAEKMQEAELAIKAGMQMAIERGTSHYSFEFDSKTSTSPLEEEIIDQLHRKYNETKDELINVNMGDYVPFDDPSKRTVSLSIHWHNVTV